MAYTSHVNETITGYRDRWPKVIHQIITRIERNALKHEKCTQLTQNKLNRNQPPFMLYIWTSYRTANITSPLNKKRHYVWLSLFEKYYEQMLQMLLDGISIFLQEYPQYKKNIRFVDTAFVTNGHHNLRYTRDGIHFTVDNHHNVVSDMITQIILNHLCPPVKTQNLTSRLVHVL